MSKLLVDVSKIWYKVKNICYIYNEKLAKFSINFAGFFVVKKEKGVYFETTNNIIEKQVKFV